MGPSGSLLHYILYVFMSLILNVNRFLDHLLNLDVNRLHRGNELFHRQIPCFV